MEPDLRPIAATRLPRLGSGCGCGRGHSSSAYRAISPVSTVRNYRAALRRPKVALMTTWEYLTAPLLIHNTKAILDNFGLDGWELVQIVPGPTPENLVAYFKRPRA